MEIGVHLPQISWEQEPLSLDRLISVAAAAERLGFGTSTPRWRLGGDISATVQSDTSLA